MKMHIFIKGLHTLNTVPYDMIKKILMYKALSLSLSLLVFWQLVVSTSNIVVYLKVSNVYNSYICVNYFDLFGSLLH